MEASTLFTTEDMTLVTVLKIRGIEPDEMSRANGGCQWSFMRCSAVDEVLDEYNAEECYVEPKDFSRKLGLVRNDMYRFLGVAPRRVRD